MVNSDTSPVTASVGERMAARVTLKEKVAARITLKEKVAARVTLREASGEKEVARAAAKAPASAITAGSQDTSPGSVPMAVPGCGRSVGGMLVVGQLARPAWAIPRG